MMASIIKIKTRLAEKPSPEKFKRNSPLMRSEIIIIPIKIKKQSEPVPIIHAPFTFRIIALTTMEKDAHTVLIIKLKSNINEKLCPPCHQNKIVIITAIKSAVENQKYFPSDCLKSEYS